MEIISISDLRKSLKGRRGKGRTERVEAVKGINLSVHEGEIFGFLGPERCGKEHSSRILPRCCPLTAARRRSPDAMCARNRGRSGVSSGT